MKNVINMRKMAEPSLNSLLSFSALKDLQGQYLWANQTFCDVFNTELHHVIGKSNEDFYYPVCQQQISTDDCAIAKGQLSLKDAFGCLITQNDKVFQTMGSKRKIALGKNTFGIMGECFILEEANPVKVFLDERITKKLSIDTFEQLSITQLKIIYCLLCLPTVKLHEIAQLLCVTNNTIYKERQNIKNKLGSLKSEFLLKKMQEAGFFEAFFLKH